MASLTHRIHRQCVRSYSMATIQRMSTITFSSVIVFYLVSRIADAATVFGTNSGWDVGGADPMCWVSNLKNPVGESGLQYTNNYTSIEALNEKLFGNQEEVTLLQRCYEGTTLAVEPLYVSQERQLFMNTKYTLRLTIETNITAINDEISLQTFDGELTIHVRLLLCDALKTGFCNPLWDSREVDNALTPFQTDLGADIQSRFAENDNKWTYDQEKQTLLGIHEDKLIYSRWLRWTMRNLPDESTAYKGSVDISFLLPLGLGPPGTYFLVGHAVMNFDVGTDTVQRIDVANVIPKKVVKIQDPPTIQTVSKSIKIGLSVVIALTAGFALFLFTFVIWRRTDPVLTISQGRFLAGIAGACVVMITSSITFLPISDIFCQLQGPLAFVPVTFVNAVLVGRIWRVYKTLSGAQIFSLQRKDAKLYNCSDTFICMLSLLASLAVRCRGHKNHQSSFKATVTAGETACLIGILTLPQLVMQVTVSVLIKRRLAEEIDLSGSIGRIVCSENGRWTMFFGIAYVAVISVTAVIIAWISRKLPSAFNEKDQVFRAAAINSLLGLVVLSILETTNAPTTHPDVGVFLRCVYTIGVAMSVLILIVWPKVKRVISGEKVVMSILLGSRYSMSAISDSARSGLNPPSQPFTVSKRTLNGNTEFVTKTPQALNASLKAHDCKKKLRTLIEDSSLPRILEEKILNVQNVLSKITNKLMEGRPLLVNELEILHSGVAGLNGELDLIFIEVVPEIDDAMSSPVELHTDNQLCGSPEG